MVRPTVVDDIPGLERVIEASGLFPPEMLSPMFQSSLDPCEDLPIWLTLDDQGPIGVAYCAPEKFTDGTWNMLLLAVHGDHQNTGHGTSLIAHLEDVLRLRNARLLMVETSGIAEFESVRRFYEKRGYTREGRIRDYYVAGDDKVIFVKSLKL